MLLYGIILETKTISLIINNNNNHINLCVICRKSISFSEHFNETDIRIINHLWAIARGSD